MNFKKKEDKNSVIYLENDKIWIKSGKTLALLIGVFGISLPFLLLTVTTLTTCINGPLESISHYYYTRAGTIFTVTLSLVAVFLIVFDAEKSFYISTFAGIFALFVVFFPTTNLTSVDCDYISKLPESKLRANFHLISAAIFILLLAYMSIFIFTRLTSLDEVKSKHKFKRDCFHVTSGIFIIIALLVMVAGHTNFLGIKLFYDTYKLTFWMETLAVVSFGISWLIRGGAFLNK